MTWDFTYEVQSDRRRRARLSTILWADARCPSSLAVEECLGDRFLCRHNPIHLKLRRTFVDFGFVFSCDPVLPLCRHYANAPLLTLNSLIAERLVPYKANVRTVEWLLSQQPDFTVSAQSLVNFIAPNYILHESAHCVAEEIIRAQETRERRAENSAVLRALICESFANTVERSAAALIGDPLHRLFFRLNSYIRRDGPAPALLTAVDRFGWRTVLALGMLSYLFQNLHARKPTQEFLEDAIDSFLAGVSISATDRDTLLDVVRGTFTLNLSFASDTTAEYFRLHGLEYELETFRETGTGVAAFETRGVLTVLDTLADAGAP